MKRRLALVLLALISLALVRLTLVLRLVLLLPIRIPRRLLAHDARPCAAPNRASRSRHAL